MGQSYNFDAIVESCGLSRAFYNEIETGKALPSLLSLQKIATALEPLTLADLVAVGPTLREELVRLTAHLSDDAVRRLLDLGRSIRKKEQATKAHDEE